MLCFERVNSADQLHLLDCRMANPLVPVVAMMKVMKMMMKVLMHQQA